MLTFCAGAAFGVVLATGALVTIEWWRFRSVPRDRAL